MGILEFAGGVVETKIEIMTHVCQDRTVWTCTPIKTETFIKKWPSQKTLAIDMYEYLFILKSYIIVSHFRGTYQKSLP